MARRQEKLYPNSHARLGYKRCISEKVSLKISGF
jgi:hypothetical protein